VQGDDFIELGMAAIDPERRPTPRALGIAVSDELESVLAKAMAVNPDDRFVDAGVFWEAMRHALRSDPAGASDHRRERRTWLGAAAAALVFGALLGSSAYSSWPIAHRFWQAAAAQASELRAHWPAARRDAPSAERAVGTPEMATAQGI
jgi:hypothetical protein